MSDNHKGKVKIGRNRWVSRQRAWQLRNKKKGLCMRCGGKLRKGSVRFCVEHAKAATEKARARAKARVGKSSKRRLRVVA